MVDDICPMCGKRPAMLSVIWHYWYAHVGSNHVSSEKWMMLVQSLGGLEVYNQMVLLGVDVDAKGSDLQQDGINI